MAYKVPSPIPCLKPSGRSDALACEARKQGFLVALIAATKVVQSCDNLSQATSILTDALGEHGAAMVDPTLRPPKTTELGD